MAIGTLAKRMNKITYLVILLLSLASGSALAECIDTDPVGDGWGWDGSSSCRVTSEPSNNTQSQQKEGIKVDLLSCDLAAIDSVQCRISVTNNRTSVIETAISSNNTVLNATSGDQYVVDAATRPDGSNAFFGSPDLNPGRKFNYTI